jgi:thiol-disulfide isomerase/thioredoxin
MNALRARVGEEIKLLNSLSKSVQEGTVANSPELEALEKHTALLRQAAVTVLESARDARNAAVSGMQKTSWKQMLSEVKIVNAADWVEAKKEGKEDSVTNVDILNSNDQQIRLVGLYFSAGWCGPCRRFTPELQKAYLIARADADIITDNTAGDSKSESGQTGWFGTKRGGDSSSRIPFEVIFISWDKDADGKVRSSSGG